MFNFGRVGSVVSFLALFLSAPLFAADFVVNDNANTVDASPGDGNCADAIGNCTLRAAIQETNALPSNDTIAVPGQTFSLIGTELIVGVTSCASPETGDLVITGAGSASTILDGGHIGTGIPVDCTGFDRIFNIDPCHDGLTVTISGLTVQHGCSLGGGGIFSWAVDASGNGGLILDDVVVKDNESRGDGGGILSYGNLTMTQSVVSGNLTEFIGGGINSDTFTFDKFLSLDNVTIDGNKAPNNDFDLFAAGGGIANSNQALLKNVTISNNEAYDACGGFLNWPFLVDTTVLINSTISGNTNMGLCNSSGTLILNNVTVTNNTVFGLLDFGGAPIQIRNTLVGANQDDDCEGEITSLGYNLIQDPSGCTISGDGTGNILGQDPLLDGLALNAPGFTETHALQTLSLAIDGGNPAGCTDGSSPLTTDQRGVPRSVDGNIDSVSRCDIGAFEYLTCGDSYVASGEQCDDGNVMDGDGCSSTCQIEVEEPPPPAPNSEPTDSDGDGVTDEVEEEIGTDPSNPDSDQDGIGDYVETDGGSPVDTDSDGILDALDQDSDGDGLSDLSEGFADDDGDGIPNFRDKTFATPPTFFGIVQGGGCSLQRN